MLISTKTAGIAVVTGVSLALMAPQNAVAAETAFAPTAKVALDFSGATISHTKVSQQFGKISVTVDGVKAAPRRIETKIRVNGKPKGVIRLRTDGGEKTFKSPWASMPYKTRWGTGRVILGPTTITGRTPSGAYQITDPAKSSFTVRHETTAFLDGIRSEKLVFNPRVEVFAGKRWSQVRSRKAKIQVKRNGSWQHLRNFTLTKDQSQIVTVSTKGTTPKSRYRLVVAGTKSRAKTKGFATQLSTASRKDFWSSPAKARLTDRFGMRTNPVTGQYRLHAGTDLEMKRGASVSAPASGIVVHSGTGGREGSWAGRWIEIDHGGGVRTVYAHLDSTSVRSGSYVHAGHRIGRAGATGRATGTHLHFEVLVGAKRKPVDPVKFLRDRSARLGAAPNVNLAGC